MFSNELFSFAGACWVILITLWFLYDCSEKRLNKKTNLKLFYELYEIDPYMKVGFLFYLLKQSIELNSRFRGLNETEKRFKAFLTKKYRFSELINGFMDEIMSKKANMEEIKHGRE